MPDGLAAFLAERLDESEALARLNVEHGLADDEKHGPDFPDYRTYSDRDTKAADDYIRHFRPRRMLRSIEADRQLLRDYRASVRNLGEGLSGSLRRIVQSRAAIYSDHPAYLPEWSPEPATAP